MSTPTGSANLNDCGCCEPAAAPPALYNRPGLPALAYRIGTGPAFLRQMLEQISKQTIPDGPNAGTRPLAALTTRGADDPAIALLDAWATAADVLTFYQERIANEGFLRTATERFSVLELARAIGYELSPGVAAGAYLAFTLDTSPGAPAIATIPVGTRVQSVPAQGKQPQTFETTADLQARAEWNALSARATQPQGIHRGLTQLYLAGTNTHLQSGDAILIVGDERAGKSSSEQWDFRILHSVEPDTVNNYTRVTWSAAALGGPLGTGSPSSRNPRVYALRQRANFFGYNAPDWGTMTSDFQAQYMKAHGASPGAGIWPEWSNGLSGTTIELDAAYPKILPESWLVIEQPGGSLSGSEVQLFRVKHSMLAADARFALAGKSTNVMLDQAANSFFHATALDRRSAIIYAQSEPLDLAELPPVMPVSQIVKNNVVVPSNVTDMLMLPTPVNDGSVTLDRTVTSLQAKQPIVVSGKLVRALVVASGLTFSLADGSGGTTLQAGAVLRTLQAPVPVDTAGTTWTWRLLDSNGVVGSVTAATQALVPAPAMKGDPQASEVNAVHDIQTSDAHTTIGLSSPLQNWYDPTTVTIAANVAPATHGETVREVLGSGDGTQANQRFVLKKPPLTYVSAATPTGGKSTLAVSVGGVQWQEQPSLYDLDSRSQSYTVRIGDDTKPAVLFGDGVSGARLPTGVANVTAVYRSGTGVDGNVDAGSLTLLQTRPLGVRGATNPVAASGGADPESLDNARQNAPLKVLTLDRIVSLQDYEDFARAFGAIGKAQAVALWSGEARIVHITIADAQGNSIAPTSTTYTSLLAAIAQFGDPTQQVILRGYSPRTFSLAATLMLDPRYDPDAVRSQVRTALTAAFSFAERDFGQPVTAAEVVTLIQGVAGVVAVDLTVLRTDPEAAATSSAFSASTFAAGKTSTSGAPGGFLYKAMLSSRAAALERSFAWPRLLRNWGVPPVLPAQKAHWEGNAIQPAELLLLNPRGATV